MSRSSSPSLPGRSTGNDVPPEVLQEDEDEAVALEEGSDVEFDLEANPGSIQRGTDVTIC